MPARQFSGKSVEILAQASALLEAFSISLQHPMLWLPAAFAALFSICSFMQHMQFPAVYSEVFAASCRLAVCSISCKFIQHLVTSHGGVNSQIRAYKTTLVCLVNVLHALFDFGPASTLHDLIWPCTFINFWTFFQTA